MYVVQVWNGKRWSKVRGGEGGPWLRRDRAERIANARQIEVPRDLSSTAGRPHRVVDVAVPGERVKHGAKRARGVVF